MTIEANIPIEPELITELLYKAMAGFNAQDPEAFTSVMHDNVELHHSAFPGVVRGRETVKKVYAGTFWPAFPDMSLELTDGPFFHMNAPRFAVEWAVRGTHRARLDPPGLVATGRRIDVTAREIGEIRDGLVQRLNIKVDMGEVLRQLGVLPPEGSRAEKALLFMQRLKPASRNASACLDSQKGKRPLPLDN